MWNGNPAVARGESKACSFGSQEEACRPAKDDGSPQDGLLLVVRREQETQYPECEHELLGEEL
jgi:hypothetical protein